MGVMPCHRKDCENIMCDIYIDGVGYICYDCQSEFKEYLKKTGKNPETEGQIQRELKIFMTTLKDDYAEGDEMSVDEYFNSFNKD